MAEKKIGDLVFRVVPMPAMQTVTMGRRIANLVGSGLPGLVGAIGAEGESRDAIALAALGSMATNLDDRFDSLIRELAEMAQVQWQGTWHDVQVDQPELVPDAGTLLLVAFFSIEVNFRSFFSGPLAKLMASKTAASMSAS